MSLPDTTPIENILQQDCDEYSKEYMDLSRSFGYPRDLVQIHKDRLGKQSTVFRGEYRMWVWVRPTWTVFVSNLKGICFEVPHGITPEKAREAWQEYRKAMTAQA